MKEKMHIRCNFFSKCAPQCTVRPLFFYNANFFFSLMVVERLTLQSLLIALRDFSKYLNSNITLWYLI